MSLTRRVLTDSGQLMLANVLSRGLGLLSLPLLTHWLAPSAYGVAALASTLISLVSVIGLMGMDMSYSRGFLSREPPNGEVVETLLWRLSSASAVVSGLVAAAAWVIHAGMSGREWGVIPSLLFLGAAGSLLLAMAQTRSRLHSHHKRLAFAIAVGGVVATVTTLLLAGTLIADERALVAGYVVAYLVPIAILGLPGWRQLAAPSVLSAEQSWSIFVVGLPGVITAPMYWVLSSSDRWFLQVSTDSATVGLYTVASTFGQLGAMVNAALVAVWLPEATRVHETLSRADGDLSLARLLTRLIAVMMVVWLGVSVFGGDLLRLLTNERFHAGADLIPWLATAAFFYGVYHLGSTGLFLSRKLVLAAALWILAGAISLSANAVLIPRFGSVAAAMVQLATFAVLALSVWLLSLKAHPLPLPKRRLAAAFLLTALAIVIGSEFPPVMGVAMLSLKLLSFCLVSATVVLLVEPNLMRAANRRWFGLNQ